jgi:hypothetical protein
MISGHRSAAAAAVLAFLVLGCGPLAAQSPAEPAAPTARASVPQAKVSEGFYYVDFRVIDGFMYGHTHIAYGRLGARGQPIDVQYAGFEPDGGMIGAAIGHVAAVTGSIKTSKESVNFAIVDSYRKKLNAQQYRTLVAAVEKAKKTPYVWNAVLHNCNDFMADMARAVGLKSPPNMVLPYMYISAMRSLNGG